MVNVMTRKRKALMEKVQAKLETMDESTLRIVLVFLETL